MADTDLRTLIDAYQRGPEALEAVAAGLQPALEADPARAQGLARLLAAEGLDAPALDGIIRALPALARAGAADDPDRTRILADPDALADTSGEVTAIHSDPHEDPTAVNPEFDDDDAAQVNVAADEDSTALNPSLDDDATIVNPVADDDATTVNPVDDNDATTVNVTADDDRTAVLAGTDDDAERSQTGASWPTEVHGAGDGIAGVDRELREGDELKGRFELISKLGEGGMGAVWKAKDKLKEEARDRNPFVAIKLLQGDFKEHPEAFIALQRETAKQQRLAHPNIATVYDFDRDNQSGTVYMTMEVMEGEPMDEFIRHIPADGLPEEEAIPLIEDICAGLNYAHAAGLVHSDLKPGNAFMVNDPEREHGRVKLLDFGIARASKTKADETGEKTLFDPGQLGALTPTYATVEMFDGQDPDPRDDIYALAIMAYQLFTGKHPYGKKPAPKALELGLTVAPIEKLNKRQNKGLNHGLAFKRDDRTASVTQFLDEIIRKKSRVPLYIAMAVAVAIVIGALGYNPTINYLNERKRDEVIAVLAQPGITNIRAGLELARGLGAEQLALLLEDKRTRDVVITYLARGDEQSLRDGLALLRKPGLTRLRKAVQDDPRTIDALAAFIEQGDEASIRTGLDLIAPFDAAWQTKVKGNSRVRKTVIGFYTDRMYQTVVPEQGKYGYDHAAEELKALEKLYPDSAEVLKIRNELAANKQTELTKLDRRYEKLLAAGKVIADPNADDIGDVREIVASIDPQYPLLKDPKLPARFAELTRAAIKANNYPRAAQLIEASRAYAPDDVTLSDLRHQVQVELKRQADEKLAAELTLQLGTRWRALVSLDDFSAARDDLLKLAELSPTSPLLAKIRGALEQSFEHEISGVIDARDWYRGEQAMIRFARLLSLPTLSTERARLVEAETAHGYRFDQTEERRIGIAERESRLGELLDKPEFTPAWERRIATPLKELVAFVAPDDPALTALRTRLGKLYAGQAARASKDHRFAEARDLLDTGQRYAPRLAELEQERQSVARDEQALRELQAAERRRARIVALKKSLIDKARANQPKEALAARAELAKELGADDPFLTTDAAGAIGGAYLRLAASMAERKDFDAASRFAVRAVEVAPGLEDAVKAAQGYRDKLIELAAAARVTSPRSAPRLAPVAPTGGGPRGALLATPDTAPEGAATQLDLPALAPDTVAAPTIAPYAPRIVARYPALGETIAARGAARIQDLAKGEPLSIAALTGPLASYAALYPKRSTALRATVAEQLETRVVALAAAEPLDITALTTPLAEYSALYPSRAAALRERVATTFEPRIVDLAKTTPLDLKLLGAPLDHFAKLFPQRAADLSDRAAAEVAPRMVALTRAKPLAIGTLGTPLAAYRKRFPKHITTLDAKIAERLEARIGALANSAGLNLDAIAGPLDAYAKLYKTRSAALRAKLADQVAKRVAVAGTTTPKAIARLGPTIQRYRQLFPLQSERLGAGLANRIAKQILALKPKDVYKADAVRRAGLALLPGSKKIMSIRLELPLQELIDGAKLLSSGRLSGASVKLAAALKTDPQHSDIPSFKKKLAGRISAAQAKYDKYVRLTMQRLGRTERTKLLASARNSWKDNKKFVDVEEPRSGLCTAALAGHGAAKASTCYDFLSKRIKGPLLVVIPVGGGVKKPFAIGKYEISGKDFGRYCRATKACKSVTARKSRQPITRISLKQAKAYTQWLSKRASAAEKRKIRYRLPSETEWEYMAKANGKQPASRAFNCRVTSGGKVIKGHGLNSAKSGKPNGWGVVNAVGNAREWAIKGSGVVARGGSFEDRLTTCSPALKAAHNGRADPLTGFRVLREIGG